MPASPASPSASASASLASASSASPKAKRQRLSAPSASLSPQVSPSLASSPPRFPDDFGRMLLLESMIHRAIPIGTHASPGRASRMLWLPVKEVSALYQTLDDQVQLESLFTDLCKQGFDAYEIVRQTMSLGFGSDIVFMVDEIGVPTVLAACIFMRIKKEKVIYVELLCSNTRNGMKLLNAFSVFAGQPNAFQDGITYTNMTLVAAGSRVKDLYKHHGFREYNDADSYQLHRALPYQMSGGRKKTI